MAWIEKYRSMGAELTNHTDGGGGIVNPTQDTRERIGAAKRGNKYWVGKRHTAETRAKLSALKTGKPMHPNTRAAIFTPEVGAKISATHRARELSAEELERKRAVVKLSFHSPEGRAKQRAAVATDEHKAALSARQSSPESIARIRAIGYSNKGRRHSEETKRKMSIRAGLHRHSEEVKAKIGMRQRGDKSHRAKLTLQQVDDIRTRYAAGGISQHQLARDCSVQPRTINLIVHNKTWVAA
jgi:hypothetical protein